MYARNVIKVCMSVRMNACAHIIFRYDDAIMVLCCME